jgi:hypothetical protein
MPPHPRSNGKPRIPQKQRAGVTILQWSKRFDTALGVCVVLWRFCYCKNLHRRAAIAQSSGEDQIDSLIHLVAFASFHDFCGFGG